MKTDLDRASRSLTITLPAPIADAAEQMAREENVSISELFRRAVRSLQLQRITLAVEELRPQSSRDAEDEALQDIYRSIKEARREEERKTA